MMPAVVVAVCFSAFEVQAEAPEAESEPPPPARMSKAEWNAHARELLSGSAKAIDHCTQTYARVFGKEGQVHVGFAVDGTGKVISASVKTKLPSQEALVGCLKAIVLGYKFPPLEAKKITTSVIVYVAPGRLFRLAGSDDKASEPPAQQAASKKSILPPLSAGVSRGEAAETTSGAPATVYAPTPAGATAGEPAEVYQGTPAEIAETEKGE